MSKEIKLDKKVHDALKRRAKEKKISLENYVSSLAELSRKDVC